VEISVCIQPHNTSICIFFLKRNLVHLNLYVGGCMEGIGRGFLYFYLFSNKSRAHPRPPRRKSSRNLPKQQEPRGGGARLSYPLGVYGLHEGLEAVYTNARSQTTTRSFDRLSTHTSETLGEALIPPRV
jgi:hypothetical protein